VTTLPAEVVTWAHDVADRFRTHQAGQPFSRSLNGHVVTPEQELTEYVIRGLVEGGCPATAAVLEFVDRCRAGHEVAA
jgi:hypothetical protein